MPVGERLLCDQIDRVSGDSAWFTSLGRGQAAALWAQANPQGNAQCLFLDRYSADETIAAGQLPSNLAILCAADFPEPTPELMAPGVVAIPLSRRGDAELARDLLQTGFERLRMDGTLMTAVDHPEDVWLHEQMHALAPHVTRIPTKHGTTYLARKTGPLKRHRDFSCEFAFRDSSVHEGVDPGKKPMPLFSRPGVFSHRRLDLGARALIEQMVIRPGDRIVDLGCGSGAVGIAAGLRSGGPVHFLDSTPRALECAARGAMASGLTFTTQLEAAGQVEPSGQFDVALTNPPYYSHHRITEILLSAAHRALRPSGRVIVVGKPNDWILERMSQLFQRVKSASCRGYVVVWGNRAND